MQTQIYNAPELTDTQITDLARALSNGALAVFATDTVYGLGTGALCEPSIKRIYALKDRPAKQPLQLLVAHVLHARQIAQFSLFAVPLAHTLWPGKLTLVVPPSEQGIPLLRGSKALGIRIPAYLPLLRILQQMTMPLASTSANLHDQPVCTTEEQVCTLFDGKVDFILKDGTLSGEASTVLDVTQPVPQLLRAGAVSPQEIARVLLEDIGKEMDEEEKETL